MRKTVVFLLTLTLLLTSLGGAAFARASHYLKHYRVGLAAKGSNVMEISYSVEGTGIMAMIGAQKIVIEKKTGSAWTTQETLYGATNPEFYGNNRHAYAYAVTFTGVAGTTYRVTLTAYAANDSGSDTGTVVSTEVVCK
ncbi:MAG: hypothetical protein AAGU12_10755 [Clostridiales bacterium]